MNAMRSFGRPSDVVAMDLPSNSTAGFIAPAANLRYSWWDHTAGGPIHHSENLSSCSLQAPTPMAAAAAGAPPGSSSGMISFSDLADVDYSIYKMLFDGLPPIAEAGPPASDAISTISEMVTSFKLPASPIANTPQQRPALDAIIPTCGVYSSGQANLVAETQPSSRLVSTVAGKLVGGKGQPSLRVQKLASRGVQHQCRKVEAATIDQVLQMKTSKSAIRSKNRTKLTPYFDQTEHILRERWRRDDFAWKYMTLESLLPPSASKRDRYTIVEQARNLVKSLQHRKEVLLKRRFQMEQAVAAAAAAAKSKPSCPPILMKLENSQLDHQVRTSSRQDLSSSPEIDQPQMEMEAVVPNLSLISRRLMHGPIVNKAGHHNSSKLRSSNPMSTSEIAIASGLQPALDLKKCVRAVKVHPNGMMIAIEMTCQPDPRFQTTLFRTLESLQLEVSNCSISRTLDTLVCNITVKRSNMLGKRAMAMEKNPLRPFVFVMEKPYPLPPNCMQRTTEDITVLLMSALEPGM